MQELVEFLPYVFDRFVRQTAPLANMVALLGLAIARHLVEIHGGTIRAESAGLGLGSSFTINFEHDSMVRASEAMVAETAALSTTVSEGIHVLLVDDDADTLELMTTALTSRRLTSRRSLVPARH